jgi:hypothetical protein
MMSNRLLNPQPAPAPQQISENVWEEVIWTFEENIRFDFKPHEISLCRRVLQDMKDRNQQGIQKYGVPLVTFNGRNPLVDLYQELLDAVVYTEQYLMELGFSDREDLNSSGTHTMCQLRETLFRELVNVRGLIEAQQ